MGFGNLGDRVQPVPRVDGEALRNDLNHRENYGKENNYNGDKIDIRA